MPVVDRHTSVRLFGSRRRHVAAAGRILATGLATSGFLGTIASLATADARSLESKQQADAATPTTLVETIHRVVYVDEFGNPIAPPTTLAPLDATTTTLAAVVDPLAPIDPLATTTTLARTPASPWLRLRFGKPWWGRLSILDELAVGVVDDQRSLILAREGLGDLGREGDLFGGAL